MEQNRVIDEPSNQQQAMLWRMSEEFQERSLRR
jgi:hypothetical protein